MGSDVILAAARLAVAWINGDRLTLHEMGDEHGLDLADIDAALVSQTPEVARMVASPLKEPYPARVDPDYVPERVAP